MPVKIMYCPQCDKKLEIKENTKLDGMKCPICNEAELTTSEARLSDYLKAVYQSYDFHIQERLN